MVHTNENPRKQEDATVIIRGDDLFKSDVQGKPNGVILPNGAKSEDCGCILCNPKKRRNFISNIGGLNPWLPGT